MTAQPHTPGDLEALVEDAYNEGWRDREAKPSPMINSRPFPKGVKAAWPKRGFR